MEIPFHKYQGTGNDFVMIDNRDLSIPRDSVSLLQPCVTGTWESRCRRRHTPAGKKKASTLKWSMPMLMAESTMCGNGGRCIVRFAEHVASFVSVITSWLWMVCMKYEKIQMQ